MIIQQPKQALSGSACLLASSTTKINFLVLGDTKKTCQ